MRPKFIAISVVLLMISTTLVIGIDLGSLGYTVDSQQREGNRTVYDARDAAGNRFSVSVIGEISTAGGELIRRSLSTFFGWPSMAVSYLRITMTEEGATVLVIPASYTYDSRELTEFMPSGMQFYLQRAVEYDFRIRSSNIFVRLRGQLTDITEFTERLVEAIDDPAGFIERNDPEYVLRELRDVDRILTELRLANEDLVAYVESKNAELSETIAALRDETHEIDDAIRFDLAETVSRIDAFHREIERRYVESVEAFTALRNDYLSTRQQGIAVAEEYYETKASHLELQERFEALLADFEALEASYATTVTNQGSTNESLQQQIELIRFAFIAEANESLFGKLRPVAPEVAGRIVAMRRESPGITAKEISSLLGDEGTKVSTKAVEFVLLTYLGIFEE